MQAAPKPLTHRQGAHQKSQRVCCLISKATDRDVLDANALGNSPLPPWCFGFQCNERYLAWDESAQVQLLKIHAAMETGKVLQPHMQSSARMSV